MNKILLVFCLAISSIGFAQIQSVERDFNNLAEKPVLLSYLSLSSSLENYNSIDLGVMTTSGKAAAYGAELGYIYNIQGLNQLLPDNLYSNVYGIKAYLYYRFILDVGRNYPRNSNTFLDIEPQFYWANFEAERIAGYSCNEQFGDCEYYRFSDSRVDRIIPGLNFKIGKIYDYDPFYVTLFFGLGYRYVHEYSDMNLNGIIPDKIFHQGGEPIEIQTGGMVKLRLGLQLAYNLWN